jgi:hypothetical protein
MSESQLPSPWGLRAVMIRDYIAPGWNRRGRDGRLRSISGWRLVVHRILWGFNRLTYRDPVLQRCTVWDSDWQPVGYWVPDA